MLYRVELIHDGSNVDRVWAKILQAYPNLQGDDLQVAIFEDVPVYWPGATPVEFGDWHGIYEAPTPPPDGFPEWFVVEPIPEDDDA